MPELPPVEAKANKPAPQVSPAPAEAAQTSIAQPASPDTTPALGASPPCPQRPAQNQPRSSHLLLGRRHPPLKRPTPTSRPPSPGRPSPAWLLWSVPEAAPPPGPSPLPPRSVPAVAATSGTRVDRNVVLASSEDPKTPRKNRKSVYKEPGRASGEGREQWLQLS